MFGSPRNEAMVATEAEQESLLAEFEQIAAEKATTEVPTTAAASAVGAPSGETPVEEPVALQKDASTASSVNLPTIMKGISIAFGLFLVALLALDIYHTKKKGILKFTGHTYAHILFIVRSYLQLLPL